MIQSTSWLLWCNECQGLGIQTVTKNKDGVQVGLKMDFRKQEEQAAPESFTQAVQLIHAAALRGVLIISKWENYARDHKWLTYNKQAVKRRTRFPTQATDSKVCILTHDHVLFLQGAPEKRRKQIPKMLSNNLEEGPQEGEQRWGKWSRGWTDQDSPPRGWKASPAEQLEPQTRKTPLEALTWWDHLSFLSPSTTVNPLGLACKPCL